MYKVKQVQTRESICHSGSLCQSSSFRASKFTFAIYFHPIVLTLRISVCPVRNDRHQIFFRVRKGCRGKYLFATLFSYGYEGIERWGIHVSCCHNFGERKYFCCAKTNVYKTRSIFKRVDVHLDKKIWRMWKITGGNERLRSCVFFFGKSCTHDYSSC